MLNIRLRRGMTKKELINEVDKVLQNCKNALDDKFLNM